jgi:putative transposase
MDINPTLLDELLKDCKTPDDLMGQKGILKQLSKALIERSLSAELTHHLGYEKHALAGKKSGNSRNGKSSKTIKSDFGDFPIEVPRDRNGDFEPQMIKKGQRRFTGFDDKILSMYAFGMTTRDIQAHLQEIYNVEVSADLISTVTSEVMEEVKEWQNRALEEVYPIVYLDALWIKVRDEGHVVNKAAYLVIGIRMDGTKDVLGIWLEKEEGAKFWLKVITELRNRGVKDILIACVDGLKGFPEAIEAVFPNTQVQVCIVHMIRNSVKYVSYKDRKRVIIDLKVIYQAISEEQALQGLDEFEQKWDKQYPMIGKTWRSNWTRISPFFAYPAEVRKIIYTTNTIESMNNGVRKVTKNRGAFPNDEAAMKLLYLAIRNIVKKWTMPVQNWPAAINQLSIIFEDRLTVR